MGDIKLKPCPCCDGTKSLFFHDYPTGAFAVCCATCGMRGPVTGYSKDGAITTWNALPRHLQWTTEKPTQDGAYWYRRHAGEKLLAHIADEMVTLLDMPGQEHISFFDGEWAGPIPEPQESTS